MYYIILFPNNLRSTSPSSIMHKTNVTIIITNYIVSFLFSQDIKMNCTYLVKKISFFFNIFFVRTYTSQSSISNTGIHPNSLKHTDWPPPVQTRESAMEAVSTGGLYIGTQTPRCGSRALVMRPMNMCFNRNVWTYLYLLNVYIVLPVKLSYGISF